MSNEAPLGTVLRRAYATGMDQRLPKSSGQMKNRPFRARLGFALAGILIVARRERSFRTQCALGVAAIAVTAAIRPGVLWSAIVALAVTLVLAFELLNASLEYLIDHLHPELAKEIGHAKDAAAGAVLLGAVGALCVGALMMISAAAR